MKVVFPQLPPVLLLAGAILGRAGAVAGWPLPALSLFALPAVAFRIAHLESRHGLLIDCLGGFLFWILAFSFLRALHPLIPAALALLPAILWPVERFVFRILRRRRSPAVSGLLALVLVESVRLYVFLGGIPWANYSVHWVDTPLFGAGHVLGESGATVIILLLGTSLYCFAARRISEGVMFSGLAILPVAVGLLIPVSVRDSHGSISFLALQPGIDLEQGQRTSNEHQLQTEQRLLDLALPAGSIAPDMIVVPESMWPSVGVPEGLDGIIRWEWKGRGMGEWPVSHLRQLQRSAHQSLLAGRRNRPQVLAGVQILYPVEAGSIRRSLLSNEAVLFGHDGRILSHRSKQRLVPFGETLFLNPDVPGVARVASTLHAVSGHSPMVSVLPHADALSGQEGVTLGTAVCWENLFESVFREQVAGGNARAFVILSNEARLGLTSEERPLVLASRWRARETGRAILRVSNSGPTALIAADGSVAADIPSGREGWLRGDLPLETASALTPYVRFGWMLMPGLAVLAVVMMARSAAAYGKSGRKSQKNRSV